MPTAALRPCRTCGALGCRQHPSTAWSHRQPVRRIRGRQLQERRARLYAKDPHCAVCGRLLLLADPRTNPLGMVRDHIVPLAEGGADDEINQQALCPSCSDAKTERESKRGYARLHYGS